MTKRLLITTALGETWPNDFETPVLFLGEWCRLYSRKERWSRMNTEILPYHWDDREKLYADYIQLNNIYESFLEALSTKLNYIHGLDYSVRYWRILIGTWLKLFINILYDRYLSIRTASEIGNVADTLLIKSNYFDWIPNNQSELNQFITTQSYNHFLYGEIIKYLNSIPHTILDNVNYPSSEIEYLMKFITIETRNKNRRNWITNIIPSSFEKITFAGTGLKFKELMKLMISQGQFPLELQRYYSMDVFDCEINNNLRNQMKFDLAKNSFENLCQFMIPRQLPKIFIEGFESLREDSNKLYSNNPKIIFIGNGRYNKDEILKVWTADNVERGSKLCIAQHGGLLGASMWCDSEDHQIAVSDRFYTWGWTKEGCANVKPLPSVKLQYVKNSIIRKRDGMVTLITDNLQSYSYNLYSVPVSAGQSLKRFDDYKIFIKNLSKEVMDLLSIRLYPKHDWGWSQFERIKDMGFESKINLNGYSMNDQLCESRLSIHTANSTTYLETLAADYPTIVFWNPYYWEIRPEAKQYFELLKSSGILYYNPESAAQQINQIYDCIDSWWDSTQVQEAKNEFVQRFAYTSDDYLNEWKKELISVLK